MCVSTILQQSKKRARRKIGRPDGKTLGHTYNEEKLFATAESFLIEKK